MSISIAYFSFIVVGIRRHPLEPRFAGFKPLRMRSVNPEHRVAETFLAPSLSSEGEILQNIGFAAKRGDSNGENPLYRSVHEGVRSQSTSGMTFKGLSSVNMRC